MKLYYSKGACSLAVRIIINELGMNCEYESVDLKSKKTQTGNDFLTINPKGAVPTLVTSKDEVLTENAVIQQYLADDANADRLLPTVGDFERYRVLEWLNYVSTEVHKGFGPLFNPNVPQEVKEEIFIPNLVAKFSFINKHLEQNQYLLSDDFTLPDGYFFVMIAWAMKMKFDFKQWPQIERYFGELLQRSSIVKSLREEGLEYSVVK
jgi:glutathione S-transferase